MPAARICARQVAPVSPLAKPFEVLVYVLLPPPVFVCVCERERMSVWVSERVSVCVRENVCVCVFVRAASTGCEGAMQAF